MKQRGIGVFCTLVLGVILAACTGEAPAPHGDGGTMVNPVDRPATDTGLDAATPRTDAATGVDAVMAVDVVRERPDIAPITVPSTFRDDQFPQFDIQMAQADLTALLTGPAVATPRPMRLTHLGMRVDGTVRLRLGNNSTCGDKRQFRFDFPHHVTFPDGYRTDRFETDRGRCYVLHEWMTEWVLRRASEAHPERHLAYKFTNVVALRFNGTLYHVETLTEDVNRDLMERFEGTRNLEFFENGCYNAPTTGFIGQFCSTLDPMRISDILDVHSFLYWAAVMKALVPGDSYPDYPYNWQLVFNQDTRHAVPLGDDLDEIPQSWEDADFNPFEVRAAEGNAQQHFLALLTVASYRAEYTRNLHEVSTLLAGAPEAATTKYAQIRATLLSVPNLPHPHPSGDDWYDFVYQEELPQWLRNRRQFLDALP